MDAVKRGSVAALAGLALALSACAGQPYHEETPHHYSKDTRGNRIACYAGDTVNEYECVPVRRHPYAYDPYWDPYWPRASIGIYYGWPYYYYGPGWYPYRYSYPYRPWRGPRHR